MSWIGGRDRERLVREVAVFETEWKAAKTGNEKARWAIAGDEYLGRAQKSAGEAAWLNLNAARRQAVNALTPEELAPRALALEEESGKLSSWRGKTVKKILDQGTAAAQVMAAMEVRDEYFQNQYHKLRLVGDQFKVLLLLAVAALAIFMALWAQPLPDDADLLNPRLMGAILLMGLLGGAFRTAKSLFTAKGTIPERMMDWWVTIVRTLFAAAAGLGGYLFYESGILHITVGESGTATDLAIAFLFGYAGERLVSKIAEGAGGENA